MNQNQQPMPYTFEHITEQDIQLISRGLEVLPWIDVNPLLQKLQMQINIQNHEREIAAQQEEQKRQESSTSSQPTLDNNEVVTSPDSVDVSNPETAISDHKE